MTMFNNDPLSDWHRLDARPASHYRETAVTAPPTIEAAPIADNNPLRPTTFDTMIGQEKAKGYMRRVVTAAQSRRRTLDHVLLTGPGGVGKSTFAKVIANEMAVDCYQVEAPVSHETLLGLRLAMCDGDILFIDEIHQQAVQARGAASASTLPEVLYSVMEDRQMVSGTERLDFPLITVIGATTDEGMLPTSFVDRFPLKPVLEPYGVDDLARIAQDNGRQLGVTVDAPAAVLFAGAARGVPRLINTYVRNAESLIAVGGTVDATLAREVIVDLNHTTIDGLTRDMQATLTFLYERCHRKNKGTGEITYAASLATISTAIGKSRDTKAIVLRVEPYLITSGLLQVGHGGRSLTPKGITRARQLLKENPR
jgi:Holliday junction DNA helicase RuvB